MTSVAFTVLLTCLTLVACGSPEEDQAEVTHQLKQLGNADPEVQLDALRELAASLDPGIPDACLPLLKSPGNSVRRNAARAIGSRWQQIPLERVPVFVKALKENLDSGAHGEVNMRRRGIGLLERAYDNPMFSRRADGRWVIYERFKKPCLIDTRNHTATMSWDFTTDQVGLIQDKVDGVRKISPEP